MTAICIPVFVKAKVDLEEAITNAEEALEGVDGMIELRCDTAASKWMTTALDFAHLPVIVTIRPTWEGGFSE
jgi:3-dehydroquinate dehydratase